MHLVGFTIEMSFGVFAVVTIKMTVFCHVTFCSLLVYRPFCVVFNRFVKAEVT